ncbi:MAG: glycoside hydrolase N-terminal domain-containing protein [Clostridia bacterium]|nr:glycoside hydrolase N-terminal domain-containing protein [Clostridia bacterium]
MNKYDNTILLNKTPASFMENAFLDGSILGNGRVGVAILGAISNEQILINHSALVHHGKNGVLQDVSDDFVTLRKKFNDGKMLEAEQVLEKSFVKKNCHLAPAQPKPMVKVKLDFYNTGVITNYERITDMKNGELAVSFVADEKEQSVRRLSIAKSTDIIAYHAAKNNGKIRVTIQLQPCDATSKFNQVKYENGYFYFSSRSENGRDFGLVMRLIVAGGTVNVVGNAVTLKDVNELTILAKPFVNADASSEFNKIKMELSLLKDNYNKLETRNAVPFKQAFEETNLTLNTVKSAADFKELIDKTNNNELTPELMERIWNFAKYLSLCLDGALLTPAGLWCADNDCYNGVAGLDGAAQLLYSGVTKTFNPEAMLKLLDFYLSYESDLKKNAARVYGMRGYFVPRVTAMDSATFGAVDSATLHFIASSALAANLFYEYYLATGDEKNLRSKVFPFMRSVFDFYSDFLKLDASGKYVTIPSYSPNATPGNLVAGRPLVNFALASSSTIDFLALQTLLNNLIAAAKILNTAKDDVAVWQDMLNKIPTFNVNGDGCLKEYTNSVFVDKVENAGVMHGYGLYPLKNFMVNDPRITYRPAVIQGATPEAEITASVASANAVKVRVRNAASYQPTRNLVMAACQLAYAGDVSEVKNLLVKIVNSSATPSGLFLSNDWRGSGMTTNDKPNLDIAVSMGVGTAITDCLVQSAPTVLKVMPILIDPLMVGSVKNLATDFAAKVSMDWDANKGKISLKIMPTKNATVKIIFNNAFHKLRNKEISWNKQLNGLDEVKLTAGKVWSIDLG